MSIGNHGKPSTVGPDEGWRVHLSRECAHCADHPGVDPDSDGCPTPCTACGGLKTEFVVLGLEEFHRLMRTQLGLGPRT